MADAIINVLMTTPQLIISGSIAMDRIMNFNGQYKDLIHPEKLHVLSVSVFVDKLETTKGGIGAGIAYNSAQLGNQPILLGSVGRDAKDYIEELEQAGINTGFIHYSDLPTASFSVLTDSDNNQVGGFYPGAMFDADELTLDKWQGQDVFVLIAAHAPDAMRKQAEQCKSFKIRYMYDPGQQVSNLEGSDMAAGLDGAEILSLNDYELGLLCEKTGLTPDQIKAKTPILITTFGKEGSMIEGTKVPEPIKIPATKPDTVADPTGAGDAYRAGFLHGYLRGWELVKCGQLGSVWASFIVEKHGTLQEVDLNKVKQRYEATFNERIEL